MSQTWEIFTPSFSYIVQSETLEGAIIYHRAHNPLEKIVSIDNRTYFEENPNRCDGCAGDCVECEEVERMRNEDDFRLSDR